MNFPKKPSVQEITQPLGVVSRGSILLLGALAFATLMRSVFQLTVARILQPEAYGVLAAGEAVFMIGGLVVGSAFPWAVTRSTAETGRSALKAGMLGNLALAILGFWGFVLPLCRRGIGNRHLLRWRNLWKMR